MIMIMYFNSNFPKLGWTHGTEVTNRCVMFQNKMLNSLWDIGPGGQNLGHFDVKIALSRPFGIRIVPNLGEHMAERMEQRGHVVIHWKRMVGRDGRRILEVRIKHKTKFMTERLILLLAHSRSDRTSIRLISHQSDLNWTSL